jgi:iron(III) transport system ATP-binding protein
VKDLSVAGITKSFGGQMILRGVDLTVAEQSFTAILGPSGSGKTTLLRIIAGFDRPDEGEVRLGALVVDDAHHRFVPCEKRRIGYVPQEGALFPHLSVGRNIAFGLGREQHHHEHHHDHDHLDHHRGRGERVRRVEELLELVGLTGLARRYPHQLSGGQQQRVALARALAVDPEIVLLDEPFSSLDASLRASVRSDVHDVLRKAGTTAILVTHDQDEALSMADQVAVLRGGVIAQIDTPTRLYGTPRDAGLAQFMGEANLIDGTVAGDGGEVETPWGRLEMVGSASGGQMAGQAAATNGVARGPVGSLARVMVRPEQLFMVPAGDGPHDDVDGIGVDGVVQSYEYFGHDAVVRVRPYTDTLPLLTVRITGGEPIRPGTKVSLQVRGAVVAWPEKSGITPP